ncbi:hypothetical protein [Kitasatospora cineracea]|uniref:hypothetical protein n=1 Tax=Kitasatospora cineracea TaxID=88074 RepID=UPI0033D4EA52
MLPASSWQPLIAELAARLKPDVTTADSTLVELVKLSDDPVPISLVALADPLGDSDVSADTPQRSERHGRRRGPC